jgi:drug/metabolite transporter (DMT)-like permease
VLWAEPWKLGLVGATGVVQLGIPYVLFQLALRRVRPVDASLLILLEPVLNPVWVALATSEKPDGFTVAGGFAILVAMIVEALKPPPPVRTPHASE